MFGVCALATLALLLGAEHLPMADAPQHEAQVALWQRMGQPEFAYAELYRFNWFTPYLPAYVIARGVAETGLGVHAGIRAVVVLAVLGLPFALSVLLRVTRRDPWLALAGFPLAFGLAFSWGFLNFLLALPLSLLVIALGFWQVERGGVRAGVAVGVASLVLFFAHPLAWGPCLLVVSARAAAEPGLTWRERALRGLPILCACPVALAWILAQKLGRPVGFMESMPLILDWTPLRLARLPSLLLGPDRLAVLALGGIALGVVLSSSGVTRERTRWVPALVGLVLYLFMPSRLMGNDFVYQRLAGLALLLALLAVEPGPASRQRTVGRGVLSLVALGWVFVLGARFERFGAEAEHYQQVTQDVPEGAEVFALIADADVESIAGSPLLHFPALLQVERSLLVEPSFSRNYPQLVLYAHGAREPLTPGYQNDYPQPETLALELARHPYTHVISRSRADVRERFPVLNRAPWVSVAASGDWRLFRAER